MRSLLLVALALVVGVTSASGQVKTFFVNQETGSNSYTGRQATVSGNNGPWATIAHANLQTIAGGVAATESGASDSTVVIYIMPGASATVTYDSLPQPRSAAAAGTRFNYYGYGTFPASGVTTTIKLRIPGGTLVRDDVTYRNLYFNGSALAINGGDRDSILQCAMNGLSLDACRFTVVDDFENYSTGTFAVNHNDVKADQVKYCTLNNGRIQNLAGSDIIKFRYTFGLTITRCRVKQVQPTGSGAQFIYCGFDSGMTWKYNHWQFVNSATGGSAPERAIFMRDSTRSFVWNSDTMLCTGPGGGKLQLAAGGAHVKTCKLYTIDSLFVKVERGPAIEVPDGMDGWTMRYCVIVANEDIAFQAVGQNAPFRGDNLIDHCTFVAWNIGRVVCSSECFCSDPTMKRKNDDGTAVMNFLETPISTAGATDTLQITNTIFANMEPDQGGGWTNLCNTTRAIQPGWTNQVGRLVMGWNLYWVKAWGDSVGDMIIGNGGNGNYSLSDWRTSFPARDLTSRVGTPAFTNKVNRDSSFLNFTPDIDPDNSFAVGGGKDGTDIGARSTAAPTFLSNRTYSAIYGDSALTLTDSLIIQNTGNATLVLSGLTVTDDTGDVGCSAVLTSSSISAGSSAYLALTVTGPNNSGARWTVSVLTNDRKTPSYSWRVFWNGYGVNVPGSEPHSGGGKGIIEP